MPELPEVETIARDLQKTILHKTIVHVDIHDAYVVKQSKASFIKQLTHQKIQAIERRGKALILDLSSGEFLIVQVMMTGQLVYHAKGAQTANPHARVSFKLNDGNRLFYNDQRKFGHLRIVKDIDEMKYFCILGPEPFAKGFTVDYFWTKLTKTSRAIKNVLLDHTIVAGIGNIYACEILFYARVDPKQAANTITKKQVGDIHFQVIRVLKAAIESRGSSMRNYLDGAGKKGGYNALLMVYGNAGKNCPNHCGHKIERITQNGRSTFFCPHCQ